MKELPDFLRMNGTAEQYYTTEEYRKVAAARRAEINRQLNEIPARIDEATQAIPDIAGLDAEEIERAIAALEKKREALMQKKAEVATSDAATTEIRTQIAEVKAQIAEGRAAHIKAENDKNAEVEADILLAQRAANKAKHDAEDIDVEIRRKTASLDALEKAREQLVTEYQTVSAETWDESQSVCPTCGQALPAEQVDKMREEFNLRKSQKLEEINRRGKTGASKTQITLLKSEIDALKTRRDEVLGDQKAKDEALEALRGRMVPTTRYEDTEEYTALTARIAELEAKLTDAGKVTTEAQNAVEDEIRAVGDAIREERDKLMQITMAENQQRRIGELEKQEKRLGAEFEELEKGLYLCDLFTK